MHAFHVLREPVRRRILELLAESEHSSGQVTAVIAKEFGITQPAVSMHLRVLRESGFATVRPEGARRIYTMDGGPLAEMDAWLQQFRTFWDHRLNPLDTEIARGRKRKKLEDPSP
ncbi:MAG: metalloregulator ArsR/SmtB family transcription factor [bacterium]|nr:metalloregulator ArsR/SmtB family transcription factor [bacterium]MDE0437244.1 metalloregulator ArsR/SmtB family transcription factor [bacterium]